MTVKKALFYLVSIGLVMGCQFQRYVDPPSVQPLFADENANAELGVLSPRLTEEMSKLLVIFKRVDRDQNGLLTEAELQNHPDFRNGIYRTDLSIRKNQALLWLNYSDRNLDQQLSWDEIANNDTPYTPMQRLDPTAPPPDVSTYIAYVFYKLDKDDNDALSPVELAKYRDYPFMTANRTTEAKVLEANAIFASYDKDENGELSNEEFTAFMGPDALLNRGFPYDPFTPLPPLH